MAIYPQFTLFKTTNTGSGGVGPNLVSFGANDAADDVQLLDTDIQTPIAGQAPSSFVALEMTGVLGADATATLPTVADLVALFGVQGNGGQFGYVLRVINNSSANFAWTVSAGSDAAWTLIGTMTVAQHTFRDFLVEVDADGVTAGLISIGTGTYS